MTLFRARLVVMFIGIAAYTAVVVIDEGLLALLPVFFGDMAKFGWPGQFNFDFMMMLSLSAIWVSWRHQFSPGGLGLGLVAFFGGAFFLSAYLLIVSFRENGDVRRLLLGPDRVQE